MATLGPVVDIAEDSVTVRRRQRHALLRLGVPIFGVVLVAVAILAILLFSHNANRRGAIALSEDLMNTLDAQIAERVSAFLDPCERLLRIVHDIALVTPRTERRAAMLRFADSALKQLPQVASIYSGNDMGEFLMLRRLDDGGREIKQISTGKNGRYVNFVDYDKEGTATARWSDPEDNFDPRTRPWYEGAVSTDGVFWTGVYVFFTTGKPGVTVSAQMSDPDGRQIVLGVDITLEDLSRFVDSLTIGEHGRAIITDNDGQLIAAANVGAITPQNGEEFSPLTVESLHNSIFNSIFDRFRVEGQGRWSIEHDDTVFLTSATPLPGTLRHWWVLLAVPEQDFIGFVARNNRTSVAFSLIIILAVIMLAVLLIRQGLRADKTMRLLAARGEMLARKSAAFVTISKQIGEGTAEAPAELTESLADLMKCARASVWRFDANHDILHCCDSFERGGRGHASGFELHRRELPSFFECIEAGADFSVTDATSDRRCWQFQNVFMASAGTRSLSVFPLHRGEQIVGVICIEDPSTFRSVEDFLPAIASMFAISLPATTIANHEPVARKAPEAPRKTNGASDATAFPIQSADLVGSPEEFAQLRAEHLAQVSAMVIRLSGSFLMAKKSSDGDTAIVSRVAEFLQEVAAEHAINYFKFVGQEAIAVTGLSEGDEHAMTRLAEAAIAIRDYLSNLVDDRGRSVEFRIGLGFGGSFGCFLGRERSQFNLWGEAIEIAGIMAQSAAPGGIQASAAAYDQLKQDFLFRPRGSFYLPGLGQSRTFVLAGQL